MKPFIISAVVVCVVATAETIVYLNRPTAPPPASVVESSPKPTEAAPPEKIAAPKPEAPRAIAVVAAEPTNASAKAPAVSETKPDDSTSPIHQAVDALLSAKNAEEKHAVFEQLAQSGQLDAAIAELKQRAADNPNNAQLPTTLGEAQLNKVRALKEAGGDRNEMGILAMQADQSFNAALKIDPQNWEANFVKAASMYYWPAEPSRDNDVVQRLAGLIDQQETMTPNPAFAQTYVVLGNQYQKIGQLDKAQATWQLGLQKFPNDSALQKKLAPK